MEAVIGSPSPGPGTCGGCAPAPGEATSPSSSQFATVAGLALLSLQRSVGVPRADSSGLGRKNRNADVRG